MQSRSYRADQLAVVVYPTHPLAARKRVFFEETLEFDHVGLPVSSAVQIMLGQAAAKAGRVLSYRAIVSTFDAALKAVHAKLGISVVPIEIAQSYASSFDVRAIPLRDAWAKRRFAVCFRDEVTLSPAARLLVEFLATFAPAMNM